MELERAFEILGLAPGACDQDVDAAYRRLRADYDARIARVAGLALRDRYAAARGELEWGRAAALRRAADPKAPDGAAPDDATSRAWIVLGLVPGASPLEVASAYVALCEEIDRELAAAPTDVVRRRCLEARAEIDAAYQHCAAAPLAAEAPDSAAGASPYETQVARATFEAPPQPLAPIAATPIRIADEPPEAPARRARRRRRPLRRVGAIAAIAVLAAAGSLGYAAANDRDGLHAALVRYLPIPADPELVEAQTAAEYLRRRVAEERRDIERRAELASERVSRVQTEVSADEQGPAEVASVALDEAQARSALAQYLHELTERHVFSSSALAEAYGHMELAAELASAGEIERAIAAYAESRSHLEATLERLDDAEAALGARNEAVDARDAWVSLAASVGLEPGEAVIEGGQRLVEADTLLERGEFAGAMPQLRRASQSFRIAFDEGRRELAARREAFEAERSGELQGGVERERVARDASAVEDSELAGLPPVSASDRAEVKLVTVPAGAFVYGCSAALDRDCPGSHAIRRAEVSAFRIDRTEVRVSEYRLCVEQGECTPPAVGGSCNWDAPERGDHPVNCVDWEQAAAYCAWIGKRLPTEQEWEKAARGTDGRSYPWGNESASCDVAVMSVAAGAGCGDASTAPVGSRDAGRSPYGLFDMAGNVLEWTGSLHESGGGARVLRGGSWRHGASSLRSTHRESALPGVRIPSVGFRCAQGAVVAETRAR